MTYYSYMLGQILRARKSYNNLKDVSKNPEETLSNMAWEGISGPIFLWIIILCSWVLAGLVFGYIVTDFWLARLGFWLGLPLLIVVASMYRLLRNMQRNLRESIRNNNARKPR